MVALLITGSAILLISCSDKSDSKNINTDKLLTQQSDSLVLVASENGQTKYRFETELLERYELAKDPYMEFRKGIDVITYDSVGGVASTLIADYAIFYELQKLWEAKGNVKVVNSEGQTLETQQLFWNQKTKKIYSNVDSKVIDGSNTIIGVGFESDEEFKDYIFRKPKGKVLMDVEPTDSTAMKSQPVDSLKTSSGGDAKVQPTPAKPSGSNPGLKERPKRKVRNDVMRIEEPRSERRIK